MFDRLEDLLIRLEEILSELQEPDVASDQNRFRKLMKEQNDLTPIVEAYKEYKTCKQAIEDSLQMLEEESDEELRELAKEELNDSKARVEELERELKILLLPKDPNDDKNVVVEIRAGAGGDEAALFAAEIYRMYIHYAESRRWKVELVECEEIGIGGMKNMSPASIGCNVCRRRNQADVSTPPRLQWRLCRKRKKWMFRLMKKISALMLCVRPETVVNVSIRQILLSV